jgi:phosphate transport system protein
MPEKFFTSLDNLRESLSAMGRVASGQLELAMDAFCHADQAKAARVFEIEDKIDDLEVRHEGQIVNLIARHQPVARDLRLLVACLRVNADIERVGDLAAKISKNATRLPAGVEIIHIDRLMGMSTLALNLWNDSLHAFLKLDEQLAQELRLRDEPLNKVNTEIISAIANAPVEDEAHDVIVTNVIAVSKHLERIGDTAVDVATEVIYATSGELARHPHLGLR